MWSGNARAEISIQQYCLCSLLGATLPIEAIQEMWHWSCRCWYSQREAPAAPILTAIIISDKGAECLFVLLSLYTILPICQYVCVCPTRKWDAGDWSWILLVCSTRRVLRRALVVEASVVFSCQSWAPVEPSEVACSLTLTVTTFQLVRENGAARWACQLSVEAMSSKAIFLEHHLTFGTADDSALTSVTINTFIQTDMLLAPWFLPSSFCCRTVGSLHTYYHWIYFNWRHWQHSKGWSLPPICATLQTDY